VTIAYLALGANLGQPITQLQAAVREIHALPNCVVTRCSSIYKSQARETTDLQPDYFNAVIEIDTSLDAAKLWRALARLEQKLGRERTASTPRNSARLIDIDMLLFGEQRLETTTLILPHPRMHQRAFVLQPLVEIAPQIYIPGVGNAKACLPSVIDQRIHPILEHIEWI
jgi:2-amino-4-hydroxy-6-hydroxymethyldihydropteridine diphosphokinase